MRTLILASAMMASLLGAAHAQLAVTDSVAISREAAEAARQLASLQSQYQQLVSTYNALSHATNINGMATGLAVPAIQNPLNGITPQSGILQGGTFAGLGAAQGQAQTLYNGQSVPPNMTPTQSAAFLAQWIKQRAMSLSAMQALALQLFAAAQSRSALLPQLQAQLQTAPDITTVNAINGRILLEQNYLQSAQTQATQLTALAQMQESLARNQILQKQQLDAQQAASDNPVDLGGL